jgi:hypothetical protein
MANVSGIGHSPNIKAHTYGEPYANCMKGLKRKKVWPYFEEKTSHVIIFRQRIIIGPQNFLLNPLAKFGSLLLWMITRPLVLDKIAKRKPWPR